MILRIPILGAVVLVLTAGLLYDFLQHRLSSPLLAFGVHPEVVTRLEESLDDQRELARHDPDHELVYRERFTSISALVRHLYVLDLNREEIAHRYQQIVFAIFAGLVIAVAGGFVWQRQRHETRLGHLQLALAALAEGRTDVEVGDRRRDTLGRIARMIEQTSRRMARDHKRLAALRNLSAWQEAARRHAHEMRTPLTGAKLELTRLTGLLEAESLEQAEEIRQTAHSAGQEIERLGTFTQQFTSFARLPRPERKSWDLAQLLDEYVTTFESAWNNLTLVLEDGVSEDGVSEDGVSEDGGPPVAAAVDRDMLRQVLVNLCDNSSLALGDRLGVVTFSLETHGENVVVRVSDDGPGIAEQVRPRLFEPYTTTRKIGHGMGLGLAISKKILLDHGGDLELETTSDAGTVFRLTLRRGPVSGSGVPEEEEA